MRKSSACTILLLLLLPALANAEPYIPDPLEVVAQWDTTQDSSAILSQGEAAGTSTPEAALDVANRLLQRAGQPGQARLYGLAEAVMEPWVQQNVRSPELLLAWARIQQHGHNFEGALAALDRVFQQEPQHISGNLLAARVHLVQGNVDAAERYCLKLLGHADLLTVSACSMEAASYEGKLAESYAQLRQMVERQALPDGPRGPWLSQMLADMAMRLDEPQQAVQWLTQPLQNADVSYLAQWADAQLAVGKPQMVLNQLGHIVTSAPAMDDTLLLRLAQAERKIGGRDQWQQLLSQRMALREQRRDLQHASDLARYYLQINLNPQKAMYWAKLNWQKAREPGDKALLEQAVALAEESENSSIDNRDG